MADVSRTASRPRSPWPLVGKGILTVVALFTAVSPYLADWNETHIYNPRWPPHAKFHNGQTVAMAALLGLATLAFVWRRRGDARTNLIAAGLFGALYWASQALAFLFPGVAYTDPEFLATGPGAVAGLAPQQILEVVALAVCTLGVGLVWRGLADDPVRRTA